jgi:antitoxin (DNA-binding transcriptional repressor) of toxin-antitoxin stability system
MTAKLRVALNELLPVKEAVRSLPQVLERLDRGEADLYVITRRNEPRAVLVPIGRYEQLLSHEAEVVSARRS